MPATIDQLIINSPFEEPSEHWRYERGTRSFVRESGRRSAGSAVSRSPMEVVEVLHKMSREPGLSSIGR